MTDTAAESVRDEYDSPWKDALERAFPEFMAFYFPEACAQIDWASGHEFKNTELRQVVRDAELGKRFADALVQVRLSSGEARWIYVHIEIQGQRDPDFAQRMFTYNYRLYDRYATPIASFAVLADEAEGWKPDRFSFDLLGCRQHFEYPVVKLIECAQPLERLETDPNPFALVTAAHLRTRQTRNDPEARYQAKRTLVRLLYRHGFDRQRILDLFAVLDWMMRLPDGLEQKLWQDIEQIEGESRMRYVTSVERLAIERGMQQGLQQGMQQGLQQGLQQGKLEEAALLIERLLAKRFGPLSAPTRDRLKTASTEQLETWTDRVLDAPTLDAVFNEH
jgi:hypothetical protein